MTTRITRSNDSTVTAYPELGVPPSTQNSGSKRLASRARSLSASPLLAAPCAAAAAAGGCRAALGSRCVGTALGTGMGRGAGSSSLSSARP